MEADILSRINEKYPKFSKGKKALADYLKQNIDRAAFDSASRIGKAAGVSESTAVRFASDLGYSGYPEMQAQFQAILKSMSTPVERMKDHYGSLDVPDILKTTIAGDMDRLEKTLKGVNGKAFVSAADVLERADSIYVLGVRNDAVLARYLWQSLRMVFDRVYLIGSTNEHELLEDMMNIKPGDAVIGISFPRYSMRTLKALEYASSQQAEIITLTDSENSPMNLYSSCNLTASCEMSSVAPSLAAPMSVINALITALSLKHSDRVKEKLEKLERTMMDYGVSGTDEMNLFEDIVEVIE